MYRSKMNIVDTNMNGRNAPQPISLCRSGSIKRYQYVKLAFKSKSFHIRLAYSTYVRHRLLKKLPSE